MFDPVCKMNHFRTTEMYKTFLNERVTGERSIWEKMKKRKMLTFKSSGKTLKTKLEGKVVELKEDRSLLQRILVISQKRPEIDLPNLIGKYEFSITPRSLFSFDGKLLSCNDKSSVMHAIEDRGQNLLNIDNTQHNIIESDVDNAKVVILDGMALVNKLALTRDIKTCKDLKILFAEKLLMETDGAPEIRLVFDKYIESSLKERTREKRTAGKSTRYIITVSTSIVGVPLKQLLSDIQTKQDITVYFAENIISILQNMGKSFVIVYETKSVTNIAGYPNDLLNHDQEEGDTLLLLQAKNVCDCNPAANVVVVSSDTDVFLLLIHFYPQLCTNTIFRTGTAANTREIDIRKMYECLGKSHVETLLGFHVFTACDQTIKFFG